MRQVCLAGIRDAPNIYATRQQFLRDADGFCYVIPFYLMDIVRVQTVHNFKTIVSRPVFCTPQYITKFHLLYEQQVK